MGKNKPGNRLYIGISLSAALVCLFLLQAAVAFINDPDLKLALIVKTDTANTYRLFYDASQGFNDKQSVSVSILPNEEFQRVEFELPASLEITRFKLSLGKNPSSTIQIRDVYFELDDKPEGSIFSAFVRDQQFGLSRFIIANDGMNLSVDSSLGTEPYIYSNNITPEYEKVIQKKQADKFLNHGRAFINNVLVALVAGGFVYTSFLLGKPVIPAFPGAKLTSLYLVLVCGCFLYIPFVSNLIWKADSIAFVHESRLLMQKPSADLQNISEYTQKYESYFNDHFAFRNLFIKWNDYLRVKYLGIPPIPLIAVGKDNWLYFNADRSTEDYKGLVRFTDDELLKIKSNLERWNEHLRAQQIEFLVVLAPDKQTVYPEYLPSTVKKVREGTRADQLIQYLRDSGSNIPLLDTRGWLLGHKDERVLYYKADSHWNNYGAFLAYQEMMRRLATRNPDLVPRMSAEYTFDEVELPNTPLHKDIASLMGMAASFPDRWPLMTPKFQTYATDAFINTKIFPNHDVIAARETGNPSMPDLVMFRDSFAGALIPFLSEHFDKSVFVWNHGYNQAIIDEQKPDIVIYEVVERLLPDLLNEM